MKPLSVFAFLKGSLGKILPVIITVCLAVTILYFMSLFVIHLNGQVDEVNLYPLEQMSMILGGKEGVTEYDVKQIQANCSKAEIIPVYPSDITYRSIIGYTGTYLLMLGEKDIPSMMKIQKFSLTSGRLPEKRLEVALHKKLAANYGLKIDSVVSKETEGWYLDEDVKVVGLFEGKGVIGIGAEDESRLKPGMPYASLVVGGEGALMETANRYIEKKYASKYQLSTFDMSQDFLDNFNGPINALEIFVGIVLVCVLGIFLANITTIQYSIRRKELEMLHAIGYTRKYIILKALKEIGTAGILGYLTGIALAIILAYGINISILSVKGLEMPLFSMQGMLTMLLIPAAITLFSMIAPLRMTRFKNIA